MGIVLYTRNEGLPIMQDEKKEQWIRLCELIPNEQDADKLLELVREINRLLEEKEERLKHRRVQQQSCFG